MKNNYLSAAQKKPILIATGILWLTVGLVYANSIGGEFLSHYDDAPLVMNSTWIEDAALGKIPKLFTNTYGIMEYLPLRDLTYLIDYLIWGLNPMGFHLTNIILFALCVTVVFRIGQLLTYFLNLEENASFLLWIPFAAALLFAVHPVHVESVAGISGRKDVLSGLFFLLSLETFLRFELSDRIRKRFFVLSLVFFSLAFLSKATVMVLPLIILLLLAFSEMPGRERWTDRFPISWIAPYVLIAAAFILLHWSVARKVGLASYQGTPLLLDQMATALESFLYYLGILFWPFSLRVKYSFSPADVLWDATLVASALAVLSIFAAAVILRKRHSALLFSLLWFALSIWPFLGIVNTASLIGERYLFIPSFAFCWLLPNLGVRFAYSRRSVIAIFSVIVVVLSVLSIQRNFVWQDDISLWRDAVAKEPKSSLNHEVYANILWDKGKKQEALEMLKPSREGLESSFLHELFMGRSLLEKGDVAGALEWFEMAEPKAPHHFSSLQNIYLLMGESYERKGELEKAAEYYARQRDESPNQGKLGGTLWVHRPALQAMEGLGRIQERYNPQIRQARSLAETRPRDMEAQYQLGYLFDILGLYDEAMIYYQKAALIEPRHPYPHFNMGLVLKKQRNCELALPEFRSTLELGAPDPALIHNLIGICYRDLYDFNAAVAAFQKAIDLAPNYFEAYRNLSAAYTALKETDKAADVLEKANAMRPGDHAGQ